MSFDESRMSISSDDFNRASGVSNSNEPVKKGCSTKKCIIAIIILACLILSILIALDVISLKKILGTNDENKTKLKIQNQVNQEIKKRTKKSKIKKDKEEANDNMPEKSNEDKNDENNEDDDKKNKEEKNGDKIKEKNEDKNDEKEKDEGSDEGENEMELEIENEKEESDREDKGEEKGIKIEKIEIKLKKKKGKKHKEKNKEENTDEKKEVDKIESSEEKKVEKTNENKIESTDVKKVENTDAKKVESTDEKKVENTTENKIESTNENKNHTKIESIDENKNQTKVENTNENKNHTKIENTDENKNHTKVESTDEKREGMDKESDKIEIEEKKSDMLENKEKKNEEEKSSLLNSNKIHNKEKEEIIMKSANLSVETNTKKIENTTKENENKGNITRNTEIIELIKLNKSKLHKYDNTSSTLKFKNETNIASEKTSYSIQNISENGNLTTKNTSYSIQNITENRKTTTENASYSIQNISDNGNIGLNPNYKKISPNDTNYTYIPVVGIDDVHGLFFPKINKIKVNNETLEYKTGGLEYVTRYLNILRDEFGPGRVLFFDGGDFYQGGIDSVLFDGEIMQDFYNLVGVNGSTIGNHEFDYSREWIENKVNKGNYPLLVNNIKDNSTNKIKGALGKKHDKSRLYNIKLSNGDTIKIGVIGLSFNMKNDKKMPNTWGNRDTWDNISFYPYIDKLEKESDNLRKKGAKAVLALAHFGLVCNQTLAMKLDMYNKSSIQGKCFREDDDSVMFKLTDKLKPGIIDGIIGGDTHMEMHHWENGIALMSTPTHARYINIMYLPFKKNESGEYNLVNDEIKIEGPLPACEKIFENYQNCELISSKQYLTEAGKLIDFSWRGKKIEKDNTVEEIYNKYYEKYKKYAEQDIVSFEGFDKIKVDKSGDCILCNTYLDAIVGIKQADFAIINRGIFPEELVPGTLTRAEFYNQMPYLDKICTVSVTGKELKDIVETVQSLGKGFYPSSNLKQTIKIDKDGKKTVTNVELYVNGTLTQIDENKNYKMASSLFVLSETSGEDFAKGKAYEVIHKKAVDKEVTCSNKTIDEEMSKYFKGKGVIDLSNKVDKDKPRIFIIEN